jgi:hypothetical protein
MECNKLNAKLIKIKAKVKGFLIVKKEKRNKPEQVVVIKKRNTILSTGFQNLLNAFQVYMSGATYNGQNANQAGIILTISSTQQITLPFASTPTISATENSAIITFSALDTSDDSYTATSEQLITKSAGYNIPIATANITVTKNSDEILSFTWIITISLSIPPCINYIPTTSPQSGGANCTIFYGANPCNSCKISSANSLYQGYSSSCTLFGLSNQYPQINFITTQLFTDIFYNNYSTGSSNMFTQVNGTTIVIYTLYCMSHFFAGIKNNSGFFASFCNNNKITCYSYSGSINPEVEPIYFQLYFQNQTQQYIGVQVEFTI